jgi:enoyl-CoA hydratase/carnithine racemase
MPGTKLATRCNSMVAMEKAFTQLPEITLGMITGV